MDIKPSDRDVKQILQSGYYLIPRFQRPYSWDIENISEYWDDTIKELDGDYFIGSMVVYKTPSGDFGVVDGQQRLATIMMILCALRNAFQKEGLQSLANGVHALVERPDINNQPKFVLNTETSYPYFQEHILKFDKPVLEKVIPKKEERNIERAFAQISKYIDEAFQAIKTDPTLSNRKKAKSIEKKAIAIRDKVLAPKLIMIELDNEDDAYIIFETLNTRGKDLTVSDLVKNHLTKLLKSSNVDTTKLLWQNILTTVEGSVADIDTDSFLHHYWLSKHDYVTAKKLFKMVKKTVTKHNALPFLRELAQDAVTYREIHETASRKWMGYEQNIKSALDALSLFRVKQQVPMTLSTMRAYKAKRLKPKKDVEYILTAIENFHFSFTAVTSQRSSGGISLMYASSARSLVNAETMEEKRKVLKELYEKIRSKVPSYQEFEANFKEIHFTNDYTKQKNLVKYILSRIHAYQNPGISASYDNMTIEHLASQSQIGINDFTEDSVGQLGNLILVPSELNNKLTNKSFESKKRILTKSKVLLDRKIKNASAWTSDMVEKRTEWLAKLAYNTIWKL